METRTKLGELIRAAMVRMWANQGSAPLEVVAEPEMMLGVEWSLLGPQWSANTCKVCRGRVVLQIWEA